MDIEAIRSFLAVVKHRSISKAAASLHVTQPAMSQRLRRLEEGLGFKLFDRDRHGVRLTRQGSYFMPYAAQLVRDLESASQVLTGSDAPKPRSFSEVQHTEDKAIIGIDGWISSPVFDATIAVLLERLGPDGFQIVTRPAPTLISLLELNRLDAALFYAIEERYAFTTLSLHSEEIVLVHHPSVQLNELSHDALRVALDGPRFVLFDNPILTHHAEITTQLIETYAIDRFHVVDDYRVMLALIRTGAYISLVPHGAIRQHVPGPDSGVNITSLRGLVADIRIDLGIRSAGRLTGCREELRRALATAMSAPR